MPRIGKSGIVRSILVGSLMFYALSGLTSILNYAFYPVISHFVETDTYGEIQFLTSLFTQLAVGFVVLNILSIIITAKYTAEHQRSAALKALNTTATSIIMVIIAAGSVILALNKDAFGFDSIVPIILLGASLVVNVPFTVTIGRLQGEGRYALSGVVGVLGAFFKLVASLTFVVLGWGTEGAIAGIGVGMVIAVAIANIIDTGWKRRKSSSLIPAISLRGILRVYMQRLTHLRDERLLALVALVAMGIMTILSTADVVFSKLMLSPHEAGQYAAVATIAKTIMYATTPLMWLALPPALANIPKSLLQVQRYIRLTLAIGLVLGVCFSIAPDFLISNFLGIDAGKYAALLPLASLAMIVFSAAFIIVATDLCRDRLRLTIISSLLACVGFAVGYFALHAKGIMVGAITGQTIGAFLAIISSLLGNKLYEKRR